MSNTDLRRILAKLESDLSWKGPNGKEMSLVVLSRADAIAVRDLIKRTLD